MLDIKSKEIEKWVKTWQNASLSLKKIKKHELRAPDYYERNRKVLDEMLQYACDIGDVRPSSGLVEQQRVFMKLSKSGDV